MQDLHLVGFTKDHRHLIFSTRKDAKSGDFVVPVDDDLLDAVDEVASHRADDGEAVEPVVETPAPPRIEAQLSVREVQARLRAGDRVEAIAADAGVDVTWVERFAPPVRAEQRRIVDRALTMPLTRPRAGTSAVPLRRAIAAAMASREVDLSAEEFEAAWSARLVGDSKWMVGFEFPNRGRMRRLEWKFDVRSGELTTKDRFASQLAFVESDEDLPPADVTVGSMPAHSGGGLARGSVTSGGLARPGSNRVNPQSRPAQPLPDIVRRPPAGPAGAPTSPRPPARPVESAYRRPVDPPVVPPAGPTPPAARPGPATSAWTPGPGPGETTGRGPAPASRPEERMVEESRREPKPVDRRTSSAPLGGRSTPPVVPPRRPAPVAAPTNASLANTRRPVPETASRLPVVGDARSESTPRRPAVIEDRRALDDAVSSQPPSSDADAVIILRAVDGPEDASDPMVDEDAARADGTARPVGPEHADAGEIEDDRDEDLEDDWVDPVDEDVWDDDEDDWDDDDEVVDAAGDDLIDDDPEEVEDDDVSDADQRADADDEWVDQEEEWVDNVEDLAGQNRLDEDRADHDDLEAEVEEEWVEEAAEFDDEFEDAADDETGPDDDVEDESPPVRPVRATLRPGRSAARRQLTAADADLPDRDEPARFESDEMVDDRSQVLPRRSSVHFRPGAATQARSGRSEPNPNGRVADPERSSGDETDTSAEPRSAPRRRRRTEPLRAR